MMKSKKKFAAIGVAYALVTGSGCRRLRAETFHAFQCSPPEVKDAAFRLGGTRFRARPAR